MIGIFQLLKAADELKIFDALEDYKENGVKAVVLAKDKNWNVEYCQRMLDALTAIKMVCKESIQDGTGSVLLWLLFYNDKLRDKMEIFMHILMCLLPNQKGNINSTCILFVLTYILYL